MLLAREPAEFSIHTPYTKKECDCEAVLGILDFSCKGLNQGQFMNNKSPVVKHFALIPATAGGRLAQNNQQGYFRASGPMVGTTHDYERLTGRFCRKTR